MLVYQIPVLMVEFATKFHQASNASAQQAGVDQRVLLVGTAWFQMYYDLYVHMKQTDYANAPLRCL